MNAVFKLNKYNYIYLIILQEMQIAAEKKKYTPLRIIANLILTYFLIVLSLMPLNIASYPTLQTSPHVFMKFS